MFFFTSFLQGLFKDLDDLKRHLIFTTLLNRILSLTGDHLPKSVEGFFIYEEEGSGVPGSSRKGNDAIVVEQWTVIEVNCSFLAI